MRKIRRKSITVRLTLLFASISTVVFLVLGILIGESVDRHFEEQDMEVLTAKLDLARHELENARSYQDLLSIPQKLDEALVGHQGLAVVVVTPDGQTLFSTTGPEFPKALLNKPVKEEIKRPTLWKTDKNIPFRGIAVSAKTGIKDAPPAIVAVATDISYHQHFMNSFRMTLWSFVLLAAVLTGFLGWVAVRRGLAPLQAIRRQAEGITAKSLDARLAIDTVPVELVPLAETFNAMLSRLENSFRRLSDFSSDLAHEFRTPVSNLLTQTQVTLSKPRTSDEYQDILASNIEEFERLSRMIADMLFIAKADEGQIVPSKKEMDLAQVVDELLEFYSLIAEEKGVSVTRAGAARMKGDPLMIRRAISNLLSNALRYTPAGGAIVVRVGESNDSAVKLAVENTGVTIPPQHLPRLFDRFYRVDASRHRESDGAGLGLAIIQSIAHAHGGTVAVRSESGMTSFELTIPG